MTIVFSHVPKTAGTSLRATLTKQFRKSKVLLDYGPQSDVTSDCVRYYIYEKQDFHAFKIYLDKKNIKLLAGHFDGHKYIPLVGARNIISVIREPTARIESEYKHLQRMNRVSKGFNEFISEASSVNKQVKWLGNIKLPLIGFVGITESYGSSISIINKLFKLKLKYLELNAAIEKKSELVASIDRQNLEKLNKLDLKFYENVRSWHQNIENQLRCSNVLVRGWVDFDSFARKFVGACWIDSNLTRENQAVEVIVLVDDCYFCTIVANEYNKYVAQFSDIRTGYVGFSIPIESLPKYRKLSFINAVNRCQLYQGTFENI
tara:strand:- start:40 stop:996 length:957 start_codon:yes stop_codon:yes gene_type:complete